MRLTNGKINHLANLVLDLLRADDTVEFYAEDRQIRSVIIRIINEELLIDDQIQTIVRRKLDSQRQRRHIQQGTETWDLLFRRYYDEEMIKRRRVVPGYDRQLD